MHPGMHLFFSLGKVKFLKKILNIKKNLVIINNQHSHITLNNLKRKSKTRLPEKTSLSQKQVQEQKKLCETVDGMQPGTIHRDMMVLVTGRSVGTVRRYGRAGAGMGCGLSDPPAGSEDDSRNGRVKNEKLCLKFLSFS